MYRLVFIFLSVSFIVQSQKASIKNQQSVVFTSNYIVENQIFSDYLKAYYASTNAPGSLLLVNRQDSIWQGAIGYANYSENKLITPNSPFHIGSISKTFTAVLVLQLVEENKLKLDDKIVNYFPELNSKVNGFGEITIRHLLAHTSGLVDPTNDNFWYKFSIVSNPKKFHNKTTLQLVKKYLLGKKLKFKPGTNYSYSNAGYWLLELLLEKTENTPIAKILEKRICEPLGLTNTSLFVSDESSFTKGYHVGRFLKMKDVTKWDKAEAGSKAPGGINSTASDLNLFFSNLFSNRLLSVTTLEEMKRIQLADCKNNECEYGLGLEVWRFDQLTAFGHNGSLLGAEANILFFEQYKTIIVLFKNSGGGSNKMFIKNLVEK